MRKKLLLTAVVLFAAAAFCRSQDFHSIKTVVFLFNDGKGYVYQEWDMTVTSGTEMYIPIDNPGNSYVHDLSVEENDVKYESDGRKWNSDRSLAAKTHRCGIVEKGGGDIELCWGQGEYGDHVYTISYWIDNLVQSYDEGDGFHWHFLNDDWSSPPEYVKLIVVNKTDTPWYWESADSCNVRYWAFGMVGESWMEDGKLVFESTEPFQRRSFFSLLCQFDKGMFSPQVEGRESWAELKEQAMKGSDYGETKDEGETLLEKIIGWGLIFVFLGIPLLVILYAIFLLLQRLYWRVTGRRYDPRLVGKAKISDWARDIPLDGNPTAFFSLIQSADRLHRSNKKEFSKLVSAYFLKWIQEGIIQVEKDPKDEKRVNLRFVKELEGGDATERKVYKGAREAAGDDLLEAYEFKSWSYKHDIEAMSWVNDALPTGRKIWEPRSPEERRKAIEFKNFLEDFTLVGEREAPEVGVWKQYMILAAVLGIAEKVAKNFEKLFPALMEQYSRQTNMYDAVTTYYIMRSIDQTSGSMMASVMKRQDERDAARRAAEAAHRRSSGGGGSISFGGGGGGYGGGHGGGSR